MMMIVTKIISLFFLENWVRSSWHICRDKVSGSCLEVKRTTSISLSGEMLCCRSSAAKHNQQRNKYCSRTLIRHCIESPGCRVLFRCLGPLPARSSTPPSTMGLCWLLHQVFSQLSRSCYNATSSIVLENFENNTSSTDPYRQAVACPMLPSLRRSPLLWSLTKRQSPR